MSKNNITLHEKIQKIIIANIVTDHTPISKMSLNNNAGNM